MSGVQLNFNAQTVAPSKPMEPIPSGWYRARIVDTGMEPTSTPGGQMLKVELAIIDGEYVNRKLFDRLNLVNANPQAVQIAYEQLSAICHATGVIDCQNTAMLHNIPLLVKVKLAPAETGKDGKSYDARNEVKGYDNINADRKIGAASAAIVPGVAGAPAGQPAWAAGAPPVAAAAPAAVPVPAHAPPAQFTPPVAAQPWQNPAAAPAPVAAPPQPFVPPAPVVAAPPAGPVMLPAAQYTYEQYKASNWTDEQLIANGLMAAPQPIAAPAAPAAPTYAPPAPVAAPAPATVAPGAPGQPAPWMQ
jgi:hypothetical protein